MVQVEHPGLYVYSMYANKQTIQKKNPTYIFNIGESVYAALRKKIWVPEKDNQDSLPAIEIKGKL